MRGAWCVVHGACVVRGVCCPVCMAELTDRSAPCKSTTAWTKPAGIIADRQLHILAPCPPCSDTNNQMLATSQTQLFPARRHHSKSEDSVGRCASNMTKNDTRGHVVLSDDYSRTGRPHMPRWFHAACSPEGVYDESEAKGRMRVKSWVCLGWASETDLCGGHRKLNGHAARRWPHAANHTKIHFHWSSRASRRSGSGKMVGFLQRAFKRIQRGTAAQWGAQGYMWMISEPLQLTPIAHQPRK